MKLSRPSGAPLAVLTMLLAVAGAHAAGLPRPSVPPVPSADARSRTFADLPDSKGPIDYSSTEGRFYTVFPSGCARLRTRMQEADGAVEAREVQVIFVNCDRWARAGEGCFVNANLGLLAGLDDRQAVETVLTQIRELMRNYEVLLTRQTPIARDFGAHGRIEGIEVLAHSPADSGEVWIRGFRLGGDMYLLMAWNGAGGLYSDPEYVRFFDDFRPWANSSE